MQHRAFLVTCLAASGLAAQTLHYAPSGHGTLEGGSNNTIPFWSQSGTYQQIHDATDLLAVFGQPAAIINSIHLRKDAFLASTIASRSIDVELNLGHTPIAALSATTTFATNIGATPTNVLPFTTLNLPALSNSAVPNPVGWSFPFATPFTYVNALGNLCWEFRHRNSSPISSAPLDAVSSLNPTLWPLFGGAAWRQGKLSPQPSALALW